MAKKRTEPTPKEAARAAASQPTPCCVGPCDCLASSKVALAAAQSIPAILSILYGLPPEDRAKLHDDVAEARSRILGGK